MNVWVETDIDEIGPCNQGEIAIQETHLGRVAEVEIQFETANHHSWPSCLRNASATAPCAPSKGVPPR